MRIFELRDVEDAVFLRAHEEGIVMALPSVVAYAIVEAVAECPCAPCDVKIEGESRQRIVGYGIAGGNGGWGHPRPPVLRGPDKAPR